jgi:hypothetical protein
MKIFYQKGLVALTHRASSRARGLTAQCKHTAATRTDSRDRQTRAALAGESRLIRGGRSGGGVLGPGGTVSGGNEKAEWERSGAAGEKTRGGGGGGVGVAACGGDLRVWAVSHRLNMYVGVYVLLVGLARNHTLGFFYWRDSLNN